MSAEDVYARLGANGRRGITGAVIGTVRLAMRQGAMEHRNGVLIHENL